MINLSPRRPPASVQRHVPRRAPQAFVLSLIVLMVGAFLSGCSENSGLDQILNPPPPPSTLTPAPPPVLSQPILNLTRANVARGPWYTLYFTIPSYPEKKETRLGGVDEAIVADFDRARTTIDAAVFDLR